MKLHKIEILNNILTDYAKYFRYFDSSKCYILEVYPFQNKCRFALLESSKIATILKYKPYLNIGHIIFCIEFSNKRKRKNTYPFLKRYLFLKDIDKIIHRYRSKLFNEIKKSVK